MNSKYLILLLVFFGGSNLYAQEKIKAVVKPTNDKIRTSEGLKDASSVSKIKLSGVKKTKENLEMLKQRQEKKNLAPNADTELSKQVSVPSNPNKKSGASKQARINKSKLHGSVQIASKKASSAILKIQNAKAKIDSDYKSGNITKVEHAAKMDLIKRAEDKLVELNNLINKSKTTLKQ